MRRALPRTLVLAALLAAGPAPLLPGRTLTAADGRTIEAEILGFDGLEKVRVKRADTGQTFTLALATLSEADQKALRAEAAEAASKPVPLQKGDVVLELSRLRFDTRKAEGDSALNITEEDWGYTITLKNNTAKPVEKLRAEYFLYVKVDALKNSAAQPRVRREKFTLAFETLPAGGRLSARSGAVTTHKTELKSGYYWEGTNDTKTRDTLEGIWLRLYQGDTLVLESASPASLAVPGKWTADAD